MYLWSTQKYRSRKRCFVTGKIALPASHEVTLTRNFPFESGIDIALISKR